MFLAWMNNRTGVHLIALMPIKHHVPSLWLRPATKQRMKKWIRNSADQTRWLAIRILNYYILHKYSCAMLVHRLFFCVATRAQHTTICEQQALDGDLLSSLLRLLSSMSSHFRQMFNATSKLRTTVRVVSVAIKYHFQIFEREVCLCVFWSNCIPLNHWWNLMP